MSVVDCTDLGVRYGSAWALQECTLSLPEGHIIALVGANGAGKTTLLHCLVGLTVPTTGGLSVLDGLEPGSDEALDRVAFVAQEAPLYRHLTVESMLDVAGWLNRRFDLTMARQRLAALDIPLRRRVGKLSGGQQAQLALALALARHPDLLVLDEPLARLDPLARHDVMALVMRHVVEEGLSVLFSSHVVAELERVADHLVLLANSRLQLAGSIDDLESEHVFLEGPSDQAKAVAARFTVVGVNEAARRTQLLVRVGGSVELPTGWEVHPVSLDDLVLAYLRQPLGSTDTGPIGSPLVEVAR